MEVCLLSILGSILILSSNIQDIVWPNIWIPCSLWVLIHKFKHHTLSNTTAVVSTKDLFILRFTMNIFFLKKKLAILLYVLYKMSLYVLHTEIRAQRGKCLMFEESIIWGQLNAKSRI